MYQDTEIIQAKARVAFFFLKCDKSFFCSFRSRYLHNRNKMHWNCCGERRNRISVSNYERDIDLRKWLDSPIGRKRWCLMYTCDVESRLTCIIWEFNLLSITEDTQQYETPHRCTVLRRKERCARERSHANGKKTQLSADCWCPRIIITCHASSLASRLLRAQESFPACDVFSRRRDWLR